MIRRAVVALLLVLALACKEDSPKPDPAPVAPAPVPAPEPEKPAPVPETDPVEDGEQEGFHLLRNGRSEEAQACFEAVLERDPDSPVAHRHLAAIHLAAGRRDEAAEHLERAVRVPERTFGRPGDVIDGTPYADFAVDLWLARSGDAAEETLLLEEALAVDPRNARAAMILSDVRWGAGKTKDALAILDEAGRALPATEDRASLLLRLAVRRLQSDDVEGYATALARIPDGTAARRIADSMGNPDLPWGISVEGRPSSRPQRVEATVEGMAFTVDELSPRDAIAAGDAVVLARLVAGPIVPEMKTVVLWGYLNGADAYLTDDVTLGEPVLIPAEEVRQGLIYLLHESTQKIARGKVHGRAIDQAFDALVEGRVGDAWDGLEGHMAHPVARYIRARIAIVRGAGAEAVALVLGGESQPPVGAAWALAYAEALLAKGEVGRALQVLKKAEKSSGLPVDHVLTRRIEALTKIKVDDDSEAVAALVKLVADRPDYAVAWEDLAGLHLAAQRFQEGRKVLVGLAKAIPGFEKLPRYVVARRKASAGIILEARTAAALMVLDETDEPEIRRLALKAAARLPIGERKQALHHFLNDSDEPVRILTLRLLSREAWPESAEPVRLCLAAKEAKVRGEAARAYRMIVGREAAPRLADLLADEAPYVREVAAQQLRALSGKEFGYDAHAAETDREAAAGKWRDWVRSLK